MSRKMASAMQARTSFGRWFRRDRTSEATQHTSDLPLTFPLAGLIYVDRSDGMPTTRTHVGTSRVCEGDRSRTGQRFRSGAPSSSPSLDCSERDSALRRLAGLMCNHGAPSIPVVYRVSSARTELHWWSLRQRARARETRLPRLRQPLVARFRRAPRLFQRARRRRTIRR